MDDRECPVHGRTYPNPELQFRRFPREDPETLAPMKAAKKGSQDAWVTRPQQSGLMSPR